MKARHAVDGQVYSLPGRGQQSEYPSAVCNGWNHSKEWLLFVVTDGHGKRKMVLVMPEQEIQAINQKIALGENNGF